MRKGRRIKLTPCLSLALVFISVLAFYCPAHASLTLESEAGNSNASVTDFAFQLRLGAIKGTRDRKKHDDLVRRYHAAFGVPLRYRFIYIIPEIEAQYVEIETTRTEGQLRSAKLRTSGDFDNGKILENVSLGGTLGAALPASLLGGFTPLQLGAFVDGRTTLLTPSLTFEELQVLYKGKRLDMKDQGNNGAVEVDYRWWSVAWVGFLTLRGREFKPIWKKMPALRPVGWVFERSTLSLAGGMLHFRLTVDVEISESFKEYVQGDQGQRVSKDSAFLKARYAISPWRRLEFELGGSATKKNGDWIYSADGVVSFAF